MNLQRCEVLLTSEQLQKIKESCIVVFGIGGVGGYATEMLARCGVGKLVLIDGDNVESSNINRQIIALETTIGKPKVEVMKARISDINPECEVVACVDRVNAENVANFFVEKVDFVVDAIDSVADKVALIKHCKEKNIPIISALGAGNRYKIPQFTVCDIYKTENDGLARKMRRLLKTEGIESLDVVYTKDKPEDVEGSVVGSMAYYPAIAGCMISSFVVNSIVNIADKTEV